MFEMRVNRKFESFAGTLLMSFQVEIGCLGGTVFFQVEFFAPLRATLQKFFFFQFDQVYGNQSEHYHLLEIARYLTYPSARIFFPHYNYFSV